MSAAASRRAARRGHGFAAALAAALVAAAAAASGSGSAIGAPQPQSQFRGVVPSTLAGLPQVPAGRLAYHGGPVMRTNTTYAIYWAPPGFALIYANMPYADQNKANGACDIEPHPNGNQADATINVASHEHIEAVTDPYGTGWFDAGGYEIADLCAWNFGSQLGATQSGAYNQAIGGGLYELQQEWSNSAGGCGLNALPPTIASFTPTLGRYGTAVTITGVNLGGATSVTLKNVPVLSFRVLSATQIRAVVPRLPNGPAYWRITPRAGP